MLYCIFKHLASSLLEQLGWTPLNWVCQFKMWIGSIDIVANTLRHPSSQLALFYFFGPFDIDSGCSPQRQIISVCIVLPALLSKLYDGRPSLFYNAVTPTLSCCSIVSRTSQWRNYNYKGLTGLVLDFLTLWPYRLQKDVATIVPCSFIFLALTTARRVVSTFASLYEQCSSWVNENNDVDVNH
jgi:hypothetical protein